MNNDLSFNAVRNRVAIFFVLIVLSLLIATLSVAGENDLKPPTDKSKETSFFDFNGGRYKTVRVCITDECGKPVPVYSDDKIDVYTDQQSIGESIPIFEKSGSYLATFYIVYRDESERQSIINKIDEHQIKERARSLKIITDSIRVDNTLSATQMENKIVEAETKFKSYSFDSHGGKLKDLKYIIMEVQYFPNGRIVGVMGRPAGPAGIPLLSIAKTEYNAPITSKKQFYNYESGNEMIVHSYQSHNGAFIGTECCDHWNVLVGDLDPLTYSFPLDKNQYPQLYQINEGFNKLLTLLIKKMNDAKNK